MKDFTLSIYIQLLHNLIKNGYTFQTMQVFIQSPLDRSIIMRHDIDRKPQNSLRTAKLENELGVKATYYFRTIPQTFKPKIIKEIAGLGHEIGYHYECLAETNGDYERAIIDFETNLARVREIYPVKNISMHGRPTSKWNSRLLWQKYDYKDYEILSEPYFDIDFNKVFYITDAGRAWNNKSINRRDKVESKYNYTFNHTNGVIKAINDNELPDKIMINIHPEHWADSQFEWYKIWCIRKAKNTVKRILFGRNAGRRNFIEKNSLKEFYNNMEIRDKKK